MSEILKEKFVELRRRAEKILSEGEKGTLQDDEMDMVRLIQELEIHQVELEIQNEELVRARDESVASRDEYLSLFNSAPVGFVVVDSQGLILRANQAAREMLAEPGERLIGSYFVRKILPADHDNYFNCLKAIRKGEKIVRELRVLGQGKGPIYVRLEARSGFDQENRSPVIHFSLSDITRQKEAEEELHRAYAYTLIQGITQGTEDMIAAVDSEFRYLYFNDAYRRDFKRLWGKDIETGTSMSEALAPWPEDQRKGRDLWRRALEGESFSTTMEFGPSEQEKQIYEMRFNPVYDTLGRQMGAAQIFRNVTAQVRMQEALRESEHLYRTVGEAIPYGIWETDSAGACTYVSDSFLEMSGLTMTEIKEFGWLQVMPPEDREPVTEHWMRCVKTGENYQREQRFRAGDGAMRFVLVIGRPLRDESGRITGWVGINLDITEKKQTENALSESEEKFRTAFHMSPSPIVISSLEDGHCIDANRAFETAMGFSREELLQSSFLKIGVWPDPEERRKLMEQVQAHGHLKNVETVFRTRDGALKTAIFSAELITLKGAQQCLSTWLDITERKRMEEALERSRDELELRVQERTAELARSNTELQDFVKIASHDLKEPLRKVRTFADMLLSQHGNSLNQEGIGFVDRMQKAVFRMQELLDALLRYSRVENQVVPTHQVDLNRAVKEALEVFELRIKEAGATIEVEELPRVEADHSQMVQLFQNLIGNSLKFQKKGEKSVVRIFSCDKKSNSSGYVVEFCVKDNGVGFDEVYVDKIFKPFERLHNRQEYEGVGMGLAICRKIVERYGGKLSARSKPGEGTTMKIALPSRQLSGN